MATACLNGTVCVFNIASDKQKELVDLKTSSNTRISIDFHPTEKCLLIAQGMYLNFWYFDCENDPEIDRLVRKKLNFKTVEFCKFDTNGLGMYIGYKQMDPLNPSPGRQYLPPLNESEIPIEQSTHPTSATQGRAGIAPRNSWRRRAIRRPRNNPLAENNDSNAVSASVDERLTDYFRSQFFRNTVMVTKKINLKRSEWHLFRN